jgi:type IV pilus modification protein PilV
VNAERGFTIIEVLIAVLILTVGLLGLASTAAVVMRMVAQGDRFTEASNLASRQFETFRSQWTGTNCAGAADGSSAVSGFTVAWRVTSIASGRARQVDVTVTSPTGRGNRTDTFSQTIVC